MQPDGTPDMAGLLRQAQLMQEQLVRAQSELAAAHVEGSAGGGLVSATMTGDGTLVSVRIDPTVVDPEDVETLEALVVAAVRDAQHAKDDLTSNTMNPLTQGFGGLGLPGL